MTARVLDGKAVQRVAKRLKLLRGVRGGVLGGKGLVALELNTGLAVALRADPDGESNEVRLVPERLPEVRARIRTKLLERIAQLVTDVDHERLEQELAILAQRLDVDEEIDRLRGHVTEVRKTFGGHEPAGRRLDFLMQELNREANTLSSKSQDIETTRAAVDMKVLIEQMREQVQNIE